MCLKLDYENIHLEYMYNIINFNKNILLVFYYFMAYQKISFYIYVP